MRKIKPGKFKKIVLELFYRLRNSEEKSKIEIMFIKNGYEIVNMEEPDKREFKIESILEKISEIKSSYGNNCRIVLFSNIKDILFASYRIYNEKIDDFIFFIDKYNYDLAVKDEILSKLSEFSTVKNDKLKGKIYTNIEFGNFMPIFDFLVQNNNFKYFDNIENFNYEIRIEKNSSDKKYILKKEERIIEFGSSGEIIEIFEEYRDYENINEVIDKSQYFIVFYVIGLLRKYDIKEVREITVPLFKYFQEKSIYDKQKIAEVIYSTKGIAFLEFKEKMGVFSLMVLLELPFAYLTNFILNTMKEDNNGNEKYFAAIIGDIISYQNKHGLMQYKEFLRDFEYIVNKLMKFYTDNKEIKNYKKYDKNAKKIAFMVDNLQKNNYSVTKFAFDIVNNIKKYNPEYEIVIFVEDNFNFIDEERLLIYSFSAGGASSEMYSKYHYEYFEGTDIRFLYSMPTAPKEVRVKDMIYAIFDFNPEVIMTTSLCSYSINMLYDYYPTMYLSMVSLNAVNAFDIELYPHIEHVKKHLSMQGRELEENMYSFEYGADFVKSSNNIYNKEMFGMKDDEYIMISVGVRLRTELSEKFIDLVVRFLNKNRNAKWYLIGEIEFPIIEKNYSNLINKQIFMNQFEENLGAFYKLCDVYLNPLRDGGGFSMVEAIVNDIPVVTHVESSAGVHYVGKTECAKNDKEYFEEIEKIMKFKEYGKEKVKNEQENLKKYEYKGVIKNLMKFKEIAKNRFIKRKTENSI